MIHLVIRRDLHPLQTGDESVIDLKILTGRRTDLVADSTRTVNRLRAQLTGIFPGLEQALDLANTGPLVLLAGYQTPAALRRTGRKRLETWLRNRKVLRADRLAETAWEAAGRRHTSLPGEKLTAQMVHTLVREVIALNQQVAELGKAIEARFRDHRDFEVITGMPGPGIILGAEFLAAIGGDMTAFGIADRLAGFGGVAPVPRDSGKISGNLHRPRRCNRRLQRVFCISALSNIRHCEESRRFEVGLQVCAIGDSQPFLRYTAIVEGATAEAPQRCGEITFPVCLRMQASELSLSMECYWRSLSARSFCSSRTVISMRPPYPSAPGLVCVIPAVARVASRSVFLGSHSSVARTADDRRAGCVESGHR